jgi:histidinol-phosphatase (PHP family)
MPSPAPCTGRVRALPNWGLPAVAFTEHADFTPWTVDLTGREPGACPPQLARWYADGLFTPPQIDLQGYRDCLDACRDAFPRLQILSGVELSEPHWHPERTRRLHPHEPWPRR